MLETVEQRVTATKRTRQKLVQKLHTTVPFLCSVLFRFEPELGSETTHWIRLFVHSIRDVECKGGCFVTLSWTVSPTVSPNALSYPCVYPVSIPPRTVCHPRIIYETR